MPHTAPYNFVPLSRRVVRPSWGHHVQHDAPLKGALCGRITVEIEAKSPLIVRGAGDQSFKGPDGLPAIPGTSLRGMLRNVVEIATFSALTRVNGHRFGVRDLHDRPHYADHMSAFGKGPNGKSFLQPLVCAGWLVRRPNDDANPAEILPCDFAKLHYSELIRFAREAGVHDFHPGKKQGAEEKYLKWTSRAVVAQTTWLATQNPTGSPPRIGRYGVVSALARTGQGQAGTLVFTGQPTNWDPPPPGLPRREKEKNAPKQHDFVFFDIPNAPALPISAEVFDQFEFVHSDAGQQHKNTRDPNPIWKHWQSPFRDGDRVPVFFLLRPDRTVRALGFAMMFRLASDLSTSQLVRNAQPLDASDERDRWDLARLIFGDVPLQDGSRSDGRHPGLRGRVSVGMAKLRGDFTQLRPVEAVLGAPKASFYPAYVEQDHPLGPGRPVRWEQQGAKKKPVWRMAMDKDAQARGWKRYRVHKDGVLTPRLPTSATGAPLTEEQRKRQVTVFRPIQLAPSARFEFYIRIHNLLPVELGALLWALDFGGDQDALHGLGMAKNLGYGAVRLRVVASDLSQVTGEAPRQDPVSEFTEYMERELAGDGGWRASRQIHELLACARPAPAAEIATLRLSPAENLNEFTDAKKQGQHLPLAGEATWSPPSAPVAAQRR